MAYSLTVELWAELSVGLVVFAVRFYSRWRYRKASGMGLDDLFAVFAVINWVLETVFLYTCGAIGNNINLTEQTALEVPDGDVPRLTLGSKLAYAAWVFYILGIWTLKGVLLCLYNRLTMGLRQQRLVWGMMVLSTATFLASLFWHIFSCYPTYRAWQIKPYPGESCTSRRGNYIIICVLDVATDIGIMAIPLPMLLQTNLSMRRKVSLTILFGSGIFVMICAILRAYYSLVSLDNNTVALGWAAREFLVAAVVVCAPSIKPLFSEYKKKVTGYGSGSWQKSGDGSNGLSRIPYNSKNDIENATTITTGNPKRAQTYKMTTIGRSQPQSESQDHINAGVDADNSSTNSNTRDPSGIVVTTEFKVSRRSASPSQ
ncbi:hypothetical protein F5Y06DRAFT_281240 [Hypoxylon sp. FL0890]|nr:hypothetical protein F5Y06DRAFT_281240 [Hypoxylon sp. FL0890]